MFVRMYLFYYKSVISNHTINRRIKVMSPEIADTFSLIFVVHFLGIWNILRIMDYISMESSSSIELQNANNNICTDIFFVHKLTFLIIQKNIYIKKYS